jgi:hypothetical protein
MFDPERRVGWLELTTPVEDYGHKAALVTNSMELPEGSSWEL